MKAWSLTIPINSKIKNFNKSIFKGKNGSEYEL